MIEYWSNLTVGQFIGNVLAILAVVMTVIEKSKKIGWNPWSKLLKWIGNGINGELIERMNTLEGEVGKLGKSVNNVQLNLDEFKAISQRMDIIDFADEIRRGVKHSKENYDRVLISASEYKEYCEQHNKFVNGVAAGSILLIEETYQERLHKNDFLV